MFCSYTERKIWCQHFKKQYIPKLVHKFSASVCAPRGPREQALVLVLAVAAAEAGAGAVVAGAAAAEAEAAGVGGDAENAHLLHKPEAHFADCPPLLMNYT